MTCTHPSVRQNKNTASSAASFYYLFLASEVCLQDSSLLYFLILSVARFHFRLCAFHLDLSLPSLVKSPPLNTQRPQKVLIPHAPASLLASLPPSLGSSPPTPHSLRGNTIPCQRIHWICCTIDPSEGSSVESGMSGGGWGSKGQEDREGKCEALASASGETDWKQHGKISIGTDAVPI